MSENNYKIFVVTKDGKKTEQKGTFVYIEDVTGFLADKERYLFPGEYIIIQPIPEATQ